MLLHDSALVLKNLKLNLLIMRELELDINDYKCVCNFT